MPDKSATPAANDAVDLEADTSTPPEDEHGMYDESAYRTEREALIKRRDELADLFDKGRVALATGGIAGTVAIVKDLVPTMQTPYKICLAVGWTFLGLSLLVSVLAVYKAAFQHHRQIEILDDDRRVALDQMRQSKRFNKHERPLSLLNTASVWLLAIGLGFAGVALFGAFATSKPSTKLKMSDNKDKPIITTTNLHPDLTRTFPSSGTSVTARPTGSGGSGGSGGSSNTGNSSNQGGGGKK